MDRRDFIRQMGLGLVAGWAFGRLSWPWQALACAPQLRLALLADAHLKSGAGLRPEAQALARAVAEINALTPPPDLVLFAGDLAHKGRPDALDLGREILSDLSSPLWAVRGEGDHGRGGAASWVRRFGPPQFSRMYQGVHFLGLDTAWRDTPQGPAFEMGPAQRQWLTTELAALDSATPLVIVSHAPLARLYLPWQQWTKDAPKITPHLARFRQVLCLHGHTHNAVASKDDDLREIFLTENRKQQTEYPLHISLPATAWPHPQAIQGTPAIVHPGLAPHGCGWTLVTLDTSGVEFRPQLWQA
ncbi:MAG: metallophosphoesterase [Desulfobaccales bacterium]